MLFSYFKNNRIIQKLVKYIEVEVKNTNALNALLREVESIDFQEKINFLISADPNANLIVLWDYYHKPNKSACQRKL